MRPNTDCTALATQCRAGGLDWVFSNYSVLLCDPMIANRLLWICLHSKTVELALVSVLLDVYAEKSLKILCTQIIYYYVFQITY